MRAATTPSAPDPSIGTTESPVMLIRQLVRVCLSYRYPALIAAHALIGAQVGINLARSDSPWWLPAAAVAALVLWGALGFCAFRLSWRTKVTLRKLLDAFGGEGTLRALRPVLLPLVLALPLAAVPGLGGMIATALATIFALGFINPSVFVHRKLIGTLVTLAVLLIGAGVLAIAAPDLPVGAWAQVGVAVLGSVSILDVLLAPRPNASRHGVGATVLLPLLVGLPTALVVVLAPAYAWVAAVVYLALLPLVLLGINFLRGIAVMATARRRLQERRLQGMLRSRRREPDEDVARESDGYYRISSPIYYGIDPDARDDRGLCAWIGGVGSTELPGDQSCVVFRQPGWAEQNPRSTRDALGAGFRQLLADLIPDLGAGVSDLEDLRAQLRAPWAVRILNPTEQVMIAKAPWEVAELIAVPCSWIADWTIPPGAGLHDREGTPCFVEKVSVEIELKLEVVAAARRADHPGQADLDILSTLLYNYNRILPACYEAVLQAFVTSVRNHKLLLIAASGEIGRGGDSDNQRIRSEVNAGLTRMLAKPISDLVEVRVIGSTLVETIAFTEQQRHRMQQLQDRQRSRQTDFDNRLKQIIADLEGALGIHRDGNVLERYQLTRRIDGFCTDYHSAVTALQQAISSEISKPGVQSHDQIANVVGSLNDEVDAFVSLIDERRDEMFEAVHAVQLAFLIPADAAVQDRNGPGARQ